MKKQLFFVACAALALASCSEKETVEMPDSAAIGFGTFVDNATRGGELTTNNLTEFYVFGKFGENVIFDGVNGPAHVTGSGANNAWTYSPTQYWQVGTYNFIAYSPTLPSGCTPAAEANEGDKSYDGVAFTDFTQGDGDNNLDLLVSQAIDPITIATGNLSHSRIDFTFNHILSMVKVTFENGFGTGVTAKITNVKLTGVNSKGSYAKEAWTMADPAVTTTAFSMCGAEGITMTDQDASKETTAVIVIPYNYEANAVKVQFNIEATYADGTHVGGETNGTDGTYVVEAVLPQVATTGWVKANRYNYVAELNISNTWNPNNPDQKPQPIEFGLSSVTEWPAYSDGGDASVTAPDVNAGE